MCWSYLGGRPDLWPIGAPLTLVGGIALLVGLILQIDILGEENRQTAAKLEHVDERLSQLKSRSAAISGGRPTIHLGGIPADAHSTQALLDELKSQLDLLARKIERREV